MLARPKRSGSSAGLSGLISALRYVMQTLGCHRPVDRLLRLRGERYGRPAAVELLDVDARVVAPLDGSHHEPRARRVEEGERGGLMAARVLVRVVADEGDVRERPVHALVDPSEAG